MPAYGETSYWEDRYTREPNSFDWYLGYRGLAQLLHAHIPLNAAILQIGVGSSRLQEEMVTLGKYEDITNVDYSTVAIGNLKELHKSIEQLKYSVADCRSMPQYKDSSFDAVIDKGTMDAILCGDQSVENCRRLFAECSRVIRPGGTMISITYGDPLSRLFYFLDPSFTKWADVQVYVIAKMEQLSCSSNDQLPSAEETVLPLMKGPFHYSNLDAMEMLSNQESVHYCYVLTKP